MKILGLIPARSGSKGIPGKNTKLLNGRPLIDYTIKPAIQSNLTKVILTTDSIQIGEIANCCGVEYLLRPKKLAEDDTPMLPVITHAIDILQQKDENYDAIMLLQPTCPLRSVEDINNVIGAMEINGAESIVSVSKVEDYHPARMYRLEKDLLKAYEEKLVSVNRQDLPAVFHRNGSIYCTRVEVIKNNRLYGKKVQPYIMNREKSINIDDIFDWRIAEFLTINSN
jgi:CMP-N,N'-diacetyllegionaminic acid synthase